MAESGRCRNKDRIAGAADEPHKKRSHIRRRVAVHQRAQARWTADLIGRGKILRALLDGLQIAPFQRAGEQPVEHTKKHRGAHREHQRVLPREPER